MTNYKKIYQTLTLLMILRTRYNHEFTNRSEAEFYYKYMSRLTNYIIIFDGEHYFPYPKKI